MAGSIAAREMGAPGEKGLRTGALGFVSNVVVGVASTAPAYSLAVSLGLVAGFVGIFSPAIMLVAFVPMLFIAIAYYYMNRADPDCGTSFTWVARAMGPRIGWMTGWAIIVADVLVMASLAEVAAIYTYSLFNVDTTTFGTASILGAEVDLGTVAIVGLGIAFIAVLTWICYVGIEVSVRTQVVLLGTELIALAVFAAVALVRVYTDPPVGAITPSLDWINPFAIGDWTAFTGALIVALFIYWGWDTTATVNEESANPTEQPGRASVVSTVLLLATYIIVTIAAQAWAGAERLAAAGEEDVFGQIANEVLGSPLDKILIIAVLTSAAASTQTTILPTARTALSMGAKGALPRFWAVVHPRFQTPTNATVWMGILSAAWYVALKVTSENVYYDAIAALGLMIAFYYGLTGFACALYYRHVLTKSVKNLVFMGILPLAGGVILALAFVKSVFDLSDPANSYSGVDWFGISVPLAVTIAFFVLGLVLMALWWVRDPAFFRNKPETFRAETSHPGAPPAMHSGPSATA